MAKVITKFSSKPSKVSFFQYFDLYGNPYFKCDLNLPLCLGKTDEEIISDYKRLKTEFGLNVEIIEMSFLDASTEETE